MRLSPGQLHLTSLGCCELTPTDLDYMVSL